MKPTFQEWKKDNPRKNINDYFQLYPEAKNNPIVPKEAFTHPPPIINIPSVKKGKSLDILLIFSSIAIVAGFFLPWINVSFFKIGLQIISGKELPNHISNIYAELPPDFTKTIYIIPIGAFLVLVGETLRVWQLKAFFEVLVCISFGYWLYTFHTIFNQSMSKWGVEIDLTSYYEMGIIITMVGVIYYVISILRSFVE